MHIPLAVQHFSLFIANHAPRYHSARVLFGKAPRETSWVGRVHAKSYLVQPELVDCSPIQDSRNDRPKPTSSQDHSRYMNGQTEPIDPRFSLGRTTTSGERSNSLLLGVQVALRQSVRIVSVLDKEDSLKNFGGPARTLTANLQSNCGRRDSFSDIN